MTINSSNHDSKVSRTNPSSSQCSDTAVILFTGLPASGKSTLAQKLQERFYHNTTDNSETSTTKTEGNFCHRLIHIEYDVLEDFLLPSTDENFEVNNCGVWNRRREAWNKARQKAMEQMGQEIQKNVKEKKISSLDLNNTTSSQTLNATPSPSTIILMDDNFHLRGMRKQIHRLLLRYQPIRFGILHVQTPINVCLERNRIRAGLRRVPDDIILKMDAAFESPRATWEVNSTMTINYSNSSNCYVYDEDESFTAQTTIDKIIKFIECCPTIVDTTGSEKDLEQQAIDRTKTLESQIQKIDKLLRSYVGRVAKFDKAYAGAANAGRKQLMQEFKAGRSLIEVDNKNKSVNRLLDAFLDLVVPVDTISDNSNSEHDYILRLQLQNTLKDLSLSY